MFSEIFPLLLLQLVLILLNAVFAMAEIAVISISDAKLEKLAGEGDKRAKRLRRLTGEPARFLATIQVAITLSGFLGSAFAADNFADDIVAWLIGLGVTIPAATLQSVAVILVTLLLSYFTLVFGELVPKRIAMRKTEGVALALSGTVVGISKLFRPIVWLLTASTNLILRMFGIDPTAEQEDVSEEDIRLMVDAGTKQGSIDSDENELIQNIFEFDNLTAGEIATHRTDAAILWEEESDEEWEATIRDNRYTMFPVCGETVDNVTGVLNAKDYFRLATRDRATVMEGAVKPAYFVPESVKADVLFRNMKTSRNRFAVVLDEYGGVTGILTMNDLVERLVGEINEDTEPSEAEEQEIVAVDECTWTVRGIAPLSEVEEALSLTLPEGDYDTFGGFIFSLYGTIPEDGSTFEVETDDLHIAVTEVLEHQVVSATVRRTTPLPTEEEDEE